MAPHQTYVSRTLAPAKPYQKKLHIPTNSPPTRHELYIDLKMSGYEKQAPADPNFIQNVRDAVSHGDVDFVVMYHGVGEEGLWQALEGVEPWHLELVNGFEELVDYNGLEELGTRWPLRSAYIAAYEGYGKWEEEDEGSETDGDLLLDEGEGDGPDHQGEQVDEVQAMEHPEGTKTLKTQPSFSGRYSQIDTLILDYPNYRELYFYPEGGAQNLRSLTICENEAIKTFTCTVICNPLLIDTLEILTIKCPTRYYDTCDRDIKRMKRFFRDSKALRKLELELRPGVAEGTNDEADLYVRYQEACPYTGLHSCLPSSLEFFSLSCPADQLTLVDFDHWISYAQSPSWLPNLQLAAFSLRMAPGRGFLLSPEEELELEGKAEQLMDRLRERGIEVVEPRTKEEMHYPLPP